MYCVYSLCNMTEAEEEPIKKTERMVKWPVTSGEKCKEKYQSGEILDTLFEALWPFLTVPQAASLLCENMKGD